MMENDQNKRRVVRRVSNKEEEKREKQGAVEETKERRLVSPAHKKKINQKKVTNTPFFDKVKHLKKRESFDDRHKRITTYLTKENHRKLNNLRVNYRIPMTEVINEALADYFRKNGV